MAKTIQKMMVVLFLSLFIMQSALATGNSIVTRTISAVSVTIGTQATIQLNVDVDSKTICPTEDASVCNDYYVIEEVMPPEIQINSVSNALNCQITTDNRLICTKLQNAQDEAITYTITAPTQVEDYFISGTFMFQGDTTPKQITGDNLVHVVPNAACVPDWQCTEWGQWTDDQCGARTRSCTDNNRCNAAESKPSEIETVACNNTLIIAIVAILIIIIVVMMMRRKKR